MVCVCDGLVSASHEPSKATGVCVSAAPSQGGDVSGGVINEHDKKQRRGHADGDCCTWLGGELVGFTIYWGRRVLLYQQPVDSNK